MSRSPRRSIRMAADALADLAGVLERYPDRRAELLEQLGPELLRQVEATGEVLARAAVRLEDIGPVNTDSAE